MPPFNWYLGSGPGGVAEPARGGGVQVVHYGREDMLLAGQVTLLRPGSYRLSFRAEPAKVPEGISWSVNCLPAQKKIAQAPLSAGSMTFAIPAAGCAAQELRLQGALAEVPATSETTVRGISLEKLR